MLNEEEYSSDTSDEDFVPQGGAESDDEDDPLSNNEDDFEDDNLEGSQKKGKLKNKKQRGKTKQKNPLLAAAGVNQEPQGDGLEEQETKVPTTKKEDDLWADFLADVDEKPAPSLKPKATKSWAHLLGNKKETQKDITSEATSSKTSNISKEHKVNVTGNVSKPSTVKVTKVFEFAGEEVKIEEEVPADSIEAKNAANSENQISTKGLAAAKRPLGLSGVINFLDNKKQKLSTLQKTKLDWNHFKNAEGIEEELETHKKSKAGYLEKQEFLERADHRQFEIEKAMRIGKRSNR